MINHMKCAVCGKEFGDGTNCQNCGVDRVIGLGNYSGYDRPSGSYGSQYGPSNNGGYAPNTTVCYACNEIIPTNSIYCPACGRKLLVECPNCGTTYSSQYKICSKCGTNREQYLKKLEVEKQRAIREEEDRKRKQREWEQQQRQCEQQIAKENKENFKGCFTLLGIYGLFFGVMMIVFAISEHGSENFRINEGKEMMCYIFAITTVHENLLTFWQTSIFSRV